MIIVTKDCFVNADKLYAVTVQQEHEEHRVKGKWKSFIKYNVMISYTAADPNNINSYKGDARQCSISFYDKKSVEGFMNELVSQYREQNPDELFLNKLADKFLVGEDK